MTDKALEAALDPMALEAAREAFYGGPAEAFKNPPVGALAVAISAYLSALPGEAEVVGRIEAIIEAYDADVVDAWNSESGERPDLWTPEVDVPVGLLREALASLQAMQARAEKAEEANKALMDERANLIETKRQQIEALTSRAEAAERERDLALEQRNLTLTEMAGQTSRAETAEARVKETEDVLGECKEALVAAEDRDNRARFRANSPRGDAEVVHLRTTAIRRARTALKGDKP